MYTLAYNLAYTPSCTCPKFGSSSTSTVYCKHIMFVFVFVLGVIDNSILGDIYISDEDPKTLLQKKGIRGIISCTEEEKTFRNKRNLQEIFDASPLMGKEQLYFLQKRRTGSASYTGRYCDPIFQIVDLCFKEQLLFHVIKTTVPHSHFIFLPKQFAIRSLGFGKTLHISKRLSEKMLQELQA